MNVSCVPNGFVASIHQAHARSCGLQAGVEAAEAARAEPAPPEVTARLVAASDICARQAALVASLAEDESNVRTMVNEQLGGGGGGGGDAGSDAGGGSAVGGGGVSGGGGGEPKFSSARLLEECGSLEGKNSAHAKELLPSLRVSDAELRAVQEVAHAAQHAAAYAAHPPPSLDPPPHAVRPALSISSLAPQRSRAVRSTRVPDR